MREERLERQLAFLLEIDRLKQVHRRSYLVHAERRENTAEHSWHLIMMALVLGEHADEPLQLGRVVRMLAVHDLVELDAGDTYVYDDDGQETKRAREQRAADRVYGLLPPDQGAELRALWEEFETGETPEARFARILDRVMPLLHNVHTGGRSWREHGIGSAQVRALFAGLPAGSRRLVELALSLIDDAVRLGYLPDSVALEEVRPDAPPTPSEAR